MKKLLVPIVIVLVAPLALGRVWTTVYRCDEKTPLAAVDPNHPTVYRDIMVGTKLVIVISSDTAEPWSGTLQLAREDEECGVLSGRGCGPATLGPLVQCPASCLPAAGRRPAAYPTGDSFMVGLGLDNDWGTPKMRPTAGDWFVVDYSAKGVGVCDVELQTCTLNIGPTTFLDPDMAIGLDTLVQTLTFTHVPSRDFNQDTIVNSADLALLTSHWGSQADPNTPATAFDLNGDGRIDVGDLAQFSAYWLERSGCVQSAPDPNQAPGL